MDSILTSNNIKDCGHIDTAYIYSKNKHITFQLIVTLRGRNRYKGLDR